MASGNQEHRQQPVASFRAGHVEAAVWVKDVEEAGRRNVQYSIRIQKRYFVRDANEWRTTEYYFGNELPDLALVASKAFEYVRMHGSSGSQGSE